MLNPKSANGVRLADWTVYPMYCAPVVLVLFNVEYQVFTCDNEDPIRQRAKLDGERKGDY